jgi:hypothetical protein
MDAIDRALLRALLHWFEFSDDFEDETLTRADIARLHEDLAEIFRELGDADRREFADRFTARARQIGNPAKRQVFEEFLARMDLLGGTTPRP